MEQKDITITINGKQYKLLNNEGSTCASCSLYNSCTSISRLCPALALGGNYFVELKVEK